jgi:hypothetical protein
LAILFGVQARQILEQYPETQGNGRALAGIGLGAAGFVAALVAVLVLA